MRLTLSQKRSIAGKRGGTATLSRHGLAHFRHIGQEGGKLGGRPRNLTYSDLMERGLVGNIETAGGKLETRNLVNADN